MVKLFCMTVGSKMDPFSVTVDASKPAINPDQLDLYLAKMTNGWINRREAEAVMLDEHRCLKGFAKMDPMSRIKNIENFGENFKWNEGDIHSSPLRKLRDSVIPHCFANCGLKYWN
ncbi:Crinkler (CRN) [Phytophthora megakarya]|uniref:Crinkler (CRN) n=1 Tax=Phytophthora megakarya TaxID=4795 RepID=A0A225V9Z0_9STRA|nr:Crinkler (CRN) [Phytophthora megakarya]